MRPSQDERDLAAEDDAALSRLGYAQELSRRLGSFSNFALSLSIICILSGGVTSFHLGYCGVGGAAIGLGWPLGCLFSLAVAMTMAQIASAFPTAGGLYHWASILGGRGWGWVTAWLNLMGLVTVLAAINVGTFAFTRSSIATMLHPEARAMPPPLLAQMLGVGLITASQGVFNHLGIRLTSRLTDLVGYLILVVALLVTVSMLACAPGLDPHRLVAFENFSGPAGGGVWPRNESLGILFALGLLLPLYTMTGFDASAHASEETLGAARNVPRGIVNSVLVSGLAGWAMLAAVVLAIPDPASASARGEHAFAWALTSVLPRGLAAALGLGIALAMYGSGLGAMTSASRMAFAFARDGGLPRALRKVSAKTRSPAAAVWTVAAAAWLFTVWTPFYATITAVCTIFLYLSYVLPTVLGARALGRTWQRMGPWTLGRWYYPLAFAGLLGCGGLILIAMQPPNERSLWIMTGVLIALAAGWFGLERRRFAGPPPALATRDLVDSPGSPPGTVSKAVSD